MSGLEIERKFLVHKDIDFKSRAVSASDIEQGYIPAQGATVRIRIRGEKGYLTIKGPSTDNGMTRYEFEQEIPLQDAKKLMKLCRMGTVSKTRYLVPVGNHTFEVDEFHGDNEGLVMAEVELGAVDEEYERPDFLGMEVTSDPRFRNSSLRKYPFILWRASLPEEYR